ncbi:NAD(P)-dependent oxidoreductase [Helicobacter pylori]|nr:NAD(P)-dependent oxidoreductase [Helicobacter pylori]
MRFNGLRNGFQERLIESLSLEKTAQKHQVTYLEAPVSGSVGAAKAGVLLILAAGNEEVITQLKPVFTHLGSQIFYLGKIGQGAGAKLSINSLLAQWGSLIQKLCC